MKTNRLISTDDLNLSMYEDIKIQGIDKWTISIRNTLFLNKPLNLGQFIPCDLEGNVLWEPKEYNIIFGNNRRNPLYGKQMKQYQEAEKRVLFKGNWVFVAKRSNYFEIRKSPKGHLIRLSVNDKIKDLVELGLELKNVD